MKELVHYVITLYLLPIRELQTASSSVSGRTTHYKQLQRFRFQSTIDNQNADDG